jgi:hypothetical protein
MFIPSEGWPFWVVISGIAAIGLLGVLILVGGQFAP